MSWVERGGRTSDQIKQDGREAGWKAEEAVQERVCLRDEGEGEGEGVLMEEVAQVMVGSGHPVDLIKMPLTSAGIGSGGHLWGSNRSTLDTRHPGAVPEKRALDVARCVLCDLHALRGCCFPWALQHDLPSSSHRPGPNKAPFRPHDPFPR